MTVPKIIIAVDGFSSTGKSSFAKTVAKEFGLLYLDSGALYRGVTLFAQEENLISRSGEISPELQQALTGLDLHFGAEGKLYIGERCVEKQIRSLEVSRQVSPISALAFVRNFVDEKLHAFGAEGGVVMDGRDIGTVVYPDAELKIFVTASDEVRARRRFDELVLKGENPVMEEVVENLRQRDFIDSHREASPLQRASDSFLLDNSEMTIREELEFAKGLIRGKFNLYD